MGNEEAQTRSGGKKEVSGYTAPSKEARLAAEAYIDLIEKDFENTAKGWARSYVRELVVEEAGSVAKAAETGQRAAPRPFELLAGRTQVRYGGPVPGCEVQEFCAPTSQRSTTS